MSLAVAKQYAKALLEAVSQPASGVSPEQALEQVGAFAALVKESHETWTVLLSPAVSQPAKHKVISRLGDALALSTLVKNFLVVVTRHRRLELLSLIQERFQALLDESLGLVRAAVSTARTMGEAEKSALEGVLARVTGKQVRCGYTVDDALIGGVAVRLGSTVFDGSVRGQLDGLRRRLTSEA